MLKGARNNDRFMYIDIEKANRLWERLMPFCIKEYGNTKVFGLNEMLRIYKYTEGQLFRKHRDGSYQRNEFELSLFTFMIYLNDDFEGGKTWFSDFEIEPKKGTALIFNHDLLHEGMKIISGTKYVFRTDIMYKINDIK